MFMLAQVGEGKGPRSAFKVQGTITLHADADAKTLPAVRAGKCADDFHCKGLCTPELEMLDVLAPLASSVAL